jgi:hypothetical protein
MTTRSFGVGPVAAADPPPAGAGRRALAGAAWLAALVAALVLLHSLGSGQLSTPPLLDRSALQDWLDERDAVVAAFALVRLLGLALAWYLLAVTVLGLAARLSRIPGLVRLADLATVPAVRRVLGTIAGVGLTASAASLMAAEMLPHEAPPAIEAVDLADAPVVLERLPNGSDVILRRVPLVEDGTATMRVEDASVPAAAREWTVQPGDHLWHVAEATLADAWGRAPSDAEVAPYWTVVVEANRARLVDPGNPDLVHPGLVVTLPEPPPAPPAG